MANSQQREILRQGVKAWNLWRDENPDIKIDLQGVGFREDDLAGVNLSRANLWKADFRRANLQRAVLSEAYLWEVDFWESNLEGAVLSNADLSYANLSDANIIGANFSLSNLTQANLSNSNLRISDLSGANLSHANLTKSDFRGVDLRGAIIKGAVLLDTNFEGARFAETTIVNVDLSKAIGLEKIRHYFPSNIGFNTIHLSNGKVPVTFLRSCGLSDLDIEYAKLANPSLDSEQITDITYNIHHLCLGGGIKYYSCFISYSSKDEEFGRQLYEDLQDNGVRCWFAPDDMKIGDQIRPTIDRQIRLRDKLLVILSKNSIKSEWVGDEVEGAIEEEIKSNRLVLFPIRLDDTVLNTRDDWAVKINRRRHIGDFSNWQDKESYQKAFERLLRDLKATGGQDNGE